MELAYLAVGIFVGIMSGFSGIGGGTMLVPVLIYLGFDIKEAVGISVMQMVFSSLFGSYLNYRKGMLNFKDGVYIGIGGFIGALGSGLVVKTVPSFALEVMFVGVVAFSLFRFFRSGHKQDAQAEHDLSPFTLIAVGMVIGLFAISMGIGGSILLTPILAGILHYPLKKAVSSGLFFVIFSSISGFISLSMTGHINHLVGLLVGLGSIVGVAMGIWLGAKTGNKSHKNLLIVIYTIILLMMLKKVLGV